MIRRTLPWLAGVALTLGLLHLGLAALAWRRWDASALWFAGSGLAIVLAALLNVAMMRSGAVDRTQKAVWLLANLAAAAFFGLAWTVLQEPQVIVGGLVFALLGVASASARTADGARP